MIRHGAAAIRNAGFLLAGAHSNALLRNFSLLLADGMLLLSLDMPTYQQEGWRSVRLFIVSIKRAFKDRALHQFDSRRL
jgi:hypothetical protein